MSIDPKIKSDFDFIIQDISADGIAMVFGLQLFYFIFFFFVLIYLKCHGIKPDFRKSSQVKDRH